MNKKLIPNTDLKPSAICLGGAHLGAAIDEESAFKLLDAFYDMGGNFIDTANVYGRWMPGGESLSERTIGKWIKNKGIRDDIVLTTKGAHPGLSTMDVQRLSAEEIRGDLEESLNNLNADVIDLYWIHRDDESRDVEEIIRTLESFVSEGKIRYYACSNWSAERIEKAYDYAREQGATGFVANQMMWSLAVPNTQAIFDKNMKRMTDEMKELHLKTGMAAIPYSAQANGYFSMLDSMKITDIPQDVLDKYNNDINLSRYKKIKELTMKYDTTIPAIILSYIINQPFVAIPTAGFENFEQMQNLLRDVDLELSSEDIKYLEG
jgi:aryl-alcohol dehydrogenase-like predicted oxidoreductase